MKRILTTLLALTMILANLMPVFAADTDLEGTVLTDVTEDGDIVELSEETESDIEEGVNLETDVEPVEEITDDKESIDDEDLPDFIKNPSSQDLNGTGEVVTDGTYKGTVNKDGTVTITGLVDGLYLDELTIPSVIKGKKVTAIGDGAFFEEEFWDGGLTIPNTVKTIGDWAFCNCYFSDSDIVIPNSVVTIGEKAFYHCNEDEMEEMGALVLGSNVISIGDYAFAGSDYDGDLIIPNSVEYIGKYAFASCGFNGKLIIGNSVKTIGDFAFSEEEGHDVLEDPSNHFIGDLKIPDSVVIIGASAFSYAIYHDEDYSRKNKLIIGKNVKTIAENAFECCNFDGDLIIPNKVTTIGNSAFCESGFDGKLGLGKSVKSIGICAFSYCEFMGDLKIPDTVKQIGGEAFFKSGFTGKLTLPQRIKTIEEGTFDCCGFIGDLTIPNSVRTIEKYAFNECNFSKILTIPKSVKSIAANAFQNCIYIRKVINNSKNDIRAFCFIDDNPEDYFISGTGKRINRGDILKKGTYTKHFIKVQRVNLNKKKKTIYKGEKFKLKVSKIYPSNAFNQKIAWKSSNPTVATVSNKGIVTGKKAGKATITATTKDGSKISTKCKIVVKAPIKVKSISIDKVQFVWEDNTITLTPKITPGNATNQKVEWSTSDPAIATVSKKGVVKGKSPGTAYITVKTKDGGKTAKCKVTVK